MTRLAFLLAIALALMLWAGGRSRQTVTHPLATTSLELGKLAEVNSNPTEWHTPGMQIYRDAGYRWVCLRIPSGIQKDWKNTLSKESQASLESFEVGIHSAKNSNLRVAVDMEIPTGVSAEGGRLSSAWSAHLGELARRLRGKVDVWKLALPANQQPSVESLRTSAEAIKSADPSASVLLAIKVADLLQENPLHPGITAHLDAVGLVIAGETFNSAEIETSIRSVRAEDNHIPVWVFLPQSSARNASQAAKVFSILAYNGVSAAFMDIPADIPDASGRADSLFRLLTLEPNYRGLASSTNGHHLHLFKSGSKTVAVAWTDNAPRKFEFTSPGKVYLEKPDGTRSEFSGGQTVQYTLGHDPVIIAGPGGWTPEGIH